MNSHGIFRIERATMADYHALARDHYRSAPPATIARAPDGSPCIRRALDHDGRLAGVLLVSMPTLNGRWRALAWPDRFAGTPSERAREINASLRTISRVIVAPRYRAIGVARMLVRHYLDRPGTPLTEAVASMGAICPFFERAGMTPYRIGPSKRDARLADALHAAHLEPWQAIDHARARDALRRSPWLAREARLWAESAGATRRFARDSPEQLLARASASAATQPTAYAHTA